MEINNENTKSVSIVVPMRNSETTILHTLNSIKKQKIQAREIIIIDNVSSDNSVSTVENYIKRNHSISIKLIKHKRNIGVGASYNEGARNAKSDLLVFMHSDSKLQTEKELGCLTKPMIGEKIVASYSVVILPDSVWKTYNFWQKFLFARVVEKEKPGLNGKFDCVKKSVFKKIGGFDDKNFGEDIGIGGEDADLHIRLSRVGNVVKTNARVIHLHYLGKNYQFKDFINNRKLLARTYGRLFRIQFKNLSFGVIFFMIKPFLAFLPLIPGMQIFGILLLSVYSLLYTPKMLVSLSTIRNPRILLVPFVNIFLLYYETFWMGESLFVVRKEV